MNPSLPKSQCNLPASLRSQLEEASQQVRLEQPHDPRGDPQNNLPEQTQNLTRSHGTGQYDGSFSYIQYPGSNQATHGGQHFFRYEGDAGPLGSSHHPIPSVRGSGLNAQPSGSVTQDSDSVQSRASRRNSPALEKDPSTWGSQASKVQLPSLKHRCVGLQHVWIITWRSSQKTLKNHW